MSFTGDPSMYQLSQMESQRAPVWLVKSHYWLGSGPDCDIYLEHPSVAPRHARLELTESGVTIHPEDPTHSIYIDDLPLHGSRVLAHGARIRLGRVVLHLRDSQREPVAADDPTAAQPEGWYLRGRSTALSNRRYAVSRDATVGRSAESDICLAVEQISRRHALLRPNETSVRVVDLGSQNGTYVNGQRVLGEMQAHIGDEIRFDTLAFDLCHTHQAELIRYRRSAALSSATRKSPATAQPVALASVIEAPAAAPRPRVRKKGLYERIATGVKTEQKRTTESSLFPVLLALLLITVLCAGFVLYLNT